MGIETMGDRRRDTCQVHGRSVETPGIVVERRTNGAGSHPAQAYPCNELIVMLSGQALVSLEAKADASSARRTAR